MNNMLVEMYRPKTFEEIVGNPIIVNEIKAKVLNKNISHLMFAGAPGTGKTTLAHVVINSLYKGVTKRKFIEINASDENGIEVIRSTVKDFARYSNSSDDIDFKIIVLDECDELTPKAQAALRRIMEQYYKHCRFILICNYKWKIIEPIQSRCSCYEFSRIDTTSIITRLNDICLKEKIKISVDALRYIAEKSNGDMRTALNSYLEKLRLKKDEILLKDVETIEIDVAYALNIVKNALNGKYINARQVFMNAIKNGNQLKPVLIKIAIIIEDQPYNDYMKGDIAESCLNSEKLIIDGCSEELIIAGFINRIMKIGRIYAKKVN